MDMPDGARNSRQDLFDENHVKEGLSKAVAADAVLAWSPAARYFGR